MSAERFTPSRIGTGMFSMRRPGSMGANESMCVFISYTSIYLLSLSECGQKHCVPYMCDLQHFYRLHCLSIWSNLLA